MSVPSPLSFTASAANLKRLAMIRLIFIGLLLLALAYAYQVTGTDIIHPVHLSTLAALSLLTLLTYWRLQYPWPVTDLEYFCQLLVDVSGLTVLLYFSGGATNPLISYYLVPLTISAAILPWRYTWLIAGLSLLAYSLMLFSYQPLTIVQPTMEHGRHESGAINLHIIGMWLTFTLSTVLITYFVVKMASALRQQENHQATNREDTLRDEQILAVATLAAGTAHELGTPLSTMAVLIDELEQEYTDDKQLGEDLHLLKQQIDNCKHILKGLVSTAQAHSQSEQTTVTIAAYLQQILTRWQVIRPQSQFDLTLDSQCQNQPLAIDPTLEQAICNLLNNAADACPQTITLAAHCESDQFQLNIRDYGAGIPLEIADQIGKPFVSTKGKGLGLGLFLSHATINRYGGTIKLYNHPEGGTLAQLILPLPNHFKESL
jgi:two-component system sensor histidine kinase RegB